MINGRSITIGRLFGINVGLNYNWFFIFILISFSLSGMYRTNFGYGAGAGFFLGAVTSLLFFASVVAHEYGHALTARVFGIKTQRINLHLFGGVAFLEREPKKPLHEFWIAIAGPIVSIVLGGFLILLHFATAGLNMPVLDQMLIYLGVINIFLGVFNCVPGFPLDGGRVVRAIIWGATGDYLKSTKIASFGGVIVGAMISMLGLFLFFATPGAGGLITAFLGIFVIYLARMSSRQAEYVAAFSDIRVRDLIRPIRVVLPQDTLLSDAREFYFRRFNMDQLPVIDGNRLVGYARAIDIETVPDRQWDWTRVREITHPYDPALTVSPDEEALTALERIFRSQSQSVPVFHGRRLLGTVTAEDLERVLRNRTA